MAAPLVVMNTYAIREGQLGGFRGFLQDLFALLEANAPGLLAVAAYLNEDGTEASVVEVHADPDSIRRYWQVIHQHTGQAFQTFVDSTTRFQIYGSPPDAMLKRATQHGGCVDIKPEHLGGFTRLAPAAGRPASPQEP